MFFSLITFLMIFSFFIILNLKYIERTVENIVNRSSLSVFNIINNYNYEYKNIINTFNNDLHISTKIYYFNYILKSSELKYVFDNKQYIEFEKNILEKKSLTNFNGEIIISDFNGNIFYPKYPNIKNYTLYERNLSVLKKSTDLVVVSPIFNVDGENYLYLSSFIFHIDNVPIGYITLEINVDLKNLMSFNIDNLNFYIIDKDTKLIWPKISLPYFIYSKIFLSNKIEEKIKFNGNFYYLKKTDFGNNVYLLSIFENKMFERYSLMYFLLISLFISLILFFWLKRYIKFENRISDNLFKINKELEIDDSKDIIKKIKIIKFNANTIFKEINTFEEIENNILNSLKVYDDILFIGFYTKIHELYEIYNSGEYKISDEIINILKNTKEIYEFKIPSQLLGIDHFLVIKENKLSELEKNLIFNGIKQMIYNYYIKINNILEFENFMNYYFGYNFKNLIIAKFKEEFNLKFIEFKCYTFKKDNNLIFLNTYSKKMNDEIIESLEILCDLNNIEVKIIQLKIPKYDSKKKKLIKEVERILSSSYDEIESSY
ncbi:cache domain-containing protein [Marinitoga sp. 38H-ov]|uniref:cache domain-containing protein n=1 Tax=Marinitoga sp. 38H-ov TaxID=1755814 RepID=UPI0019D10B18|nr:cache domain-containing protein [Marinitoga sp. 38H-ov]